MWRTYTNDTDSIRSFIDADGDPVTIKIGETKTYLAKRESISENGVVSTPPAGMQEVKNIYRNPDTGRMEIEFTDALKG